MFSFAKVIGLLRVKSKVDAGTVFDETPSYMRFKGAFTENYVLDELVAYGKEPYFWRSGNIAENDLDGTKTYSIPLYLCWNLDRFRIKG